MKPFILILITLFILTPIVLAQNDSSFLKTKLVTTKPVYEKKIDNKIIRYQKNLKKGKFKKAYKDWIYVYENASPLHTPILLEGRHILENCFNLTNEVDIQLREYLCEIYYLISKFGVSLVLNDKFWAFESKIGYNPLMEKIKALIFTDRRIDDLHLFLILMKKYPQTYYQNNKSKFVSTARFLVKNKNDAYRFLKVFPNDYRNRFIFEDYSEKYKKAKGHKYKILAMEELDEEFLCGQIIEMLNAINEVGESKFDKKFGRHSLEAVKGFKLFTKLDMHNFFGDCTNGFGATFQLDNQILYIGNFKDGLKSGNGKLFVFGYNNENRKDYTELKSAFNGNFLKGRQEGYGELISKSSKYYYKGHWRRGQYHGDGIEHIKQGIWYRGNWKRGKKNGKGTMSYKHTRYTGEWMKGKKHGNGSMYYGYGAEYTGNWHNDFKHGVGVYENCNRKQMESLVQFNTDKMIKGRTVKGEWYLDTLKGSASIYDETKQLIYEGEVGNYLWQSYDYIKFYAPSGKGTHYYINNPQIVKFKGKFKSGKEFVSGRYYFKDGTSKTYHEQHYGPARKSTSFFGFDLSGSSSSNNSSNYSSKSSFCYKITNKDTNPFHNKITYTIECGNGSSESIKYNPDKHPSYGIMPMIGQPDYKYNSLKKAAESACNCD